MANACRQHARARYHDAMKIFGDARSTNTRKVLTTLAELAMDYDLVHVDFALGEHKSESHLARQPFGQMPALEDEGFVLYESHAMCRYLNDKAGGKLMPRELHARALADQWMSIEAANVSGHAMKFVYHYLLQVPHESSVLEQAGAALDKAFTVMSQQLSKAPFVAGQAFTLADICFMPYFEYMQLTPAQELIAKHAPVLRWWNANRGRPSWRAVATRG